MTHETQIQKHILRQYKANKMITTKRVCEGVYNVTTSNGNRYHIEDSRYEGSELYNEWIVRAGHFQEDFGIDDNWCDTFPSKWEAEIEIVQWN